MGGRCFVQSVILWELVLPSVEHAKFCQLRVGQGAEVDNLSTALEGQHCGAESILNMPDGFKLQTQLLRKYSA